MATCETAGMAAAAAPLTAPAVVYQKALNLAQWALATEELRRVDLRPLLPELGDVKRDFGEMSERLKGLSPETVCSIVSHVFLRPGVCEFVKAQQLSPEVEAKLLRYCDCFRELLLG